MFQPGRFPCSLTRAFTVLVVLSLCCLVPLYAQVTGTLRVLVSDTTGAIIPGSEVQAVNVDTNATLTGLTNEYGYVVFTPIPRGTYNVNVSTPGFTSVK